MAIPNWNEERNKLRTRFNTGEITQAKTKELEKYLVVLASSLWSWDLGKREQYKEETEAFAIVVRHLLLIRLGEELHAKSHRISVVALVVAVAAAVFAGLSWHSDFQQHAPTAPPNVSPVAISGETSKASIPSLVQQLPSPATQSVPYIASTNPMPVPSTISTNR